MTVLYANNAMPQIKIACPHCYIVSRYDASFIEDAIAEKKGIECVACFLSFSVLIVRHCEAVEKTNISPA